jgi:SRSO17 transposase
MGLGRVENSGSRFVTFFRGLASVIGHADRLGPLRDYLVGLMLPGDRKSVEPMAARTAPARTAAQHQSLLHFVGVAAWSDEKVLGKVCEMVLPEIERHGPIKAWIIDDTGFPKKGTHSVGVARQYCGQLGKQDNCQVAVSLSIANHRASLPVAYRLYLPKDWAEDGERRRKVAVPEEISFKTKPQIALEQLRRACETGLPRGAVLADPAYGNDARFRAGITALGLIYAVGIQSNTLVWPSHVEPKRGDKPPTKKGRRDEPDLTSAKKMALGLPKSSWRKIKWREGSADWLSSRFARVRVRVGHRHRRPEDRSQEWLLIEWPADEKEPTKYWLSTLPEEISFRGLVDRTKLRWRIERDYQELKQEVGLGHYEGRGWRGFHHHATMCIAAYGFLISETGTIPPSGSACATFFPKLAVPDGYRPRGSALAAGTPCPKLDRNRAHTIDRRTRQNSAPMSVLWNPRGKLSSIKLMTQ